MTPDIQFYGGQVWASHWPRNRSFSANRSFGKVIVQPFLKILGLPSAGTTYCVMFREAQLLAAHTFLIFKIFHDVLHLNYKVENKDQSNYYQ